jgi:hypothetical protein
MAEEQIPREGAQFFSHVLPSPQPQTLSARRVARQSCAALRPGPIIVDSLRSGMGLPLGIPGDGDRRFRAIVIAIPG